MNYTKLISLGFILAVLLFPSCARKELSPRAQERQNPVQVQKETAVSGIEPWKEKWDNTIQTARKEGAVVIYTSAGVAGAVKELVPIFKQKFGINLELMTARGSELIPKLVRERASGLFLGDIFIGGLNTIYGDAKPAGLLDPIEPTLMLPEVLDPKVWYGGELPIDDKGRYIFKPSAYPSAMIAINTTLVKPDEIKSYYDLLNPRWKDKIIFFDPTIAGSAINGFASLIYNKVLDLDFFRQLVKQGGMASRDARLQADWLAKGKYPIALWASTGIVSEFMEAGAPINYTEVKEGTYLSVGSANLALLKNAPHPNASMIFINYLLSKEGQMHMQKYLLIQSARVDLPTDDVDPMLLRKPGQRYFKGANGIEEWVLNEQDKYLEYAKQIFAPLK